MTLAANHYDLIVIGSGPAGEQGAVQAASFGKRVALIEKEPHLGGAAANTGTIPSKTLRETALYLSGFRQRGLYGIEANLRERATVQDFLHRERAVKETERKRIGANLHMHGITVFKGTARFTDSHSVRVNTDAQIITADQFLIATGSRPFRPEPYPFEDACVYDSDEILSLERIPESLIVVGGGVIGCEYACIFAALGTRVSILEARPQLLAFLDDEMVAVLKNRMEHLGVRFVMGDMVSEVVGSPNCKLDGGYTLRLASGTEIEGETILIAAGRTGNTDTLGVDEIGVAVNNRGQVSVDAQFRTSVAHIFAAGDVIGNPALASAAMDQGRLAMCHAFHRGHRQVMAPILPYGIYTIPEASAAGETEEDAVAKGIPVVVGRAYFAQNARGQIIGEEHGFLKLVFQKPEMILIGCHIIGEQASELVHIGLTAMLAKQGADLFLQTCYNYPTLSEAYKHATYDALSKLTEESTAS
ncbi:MAG: Si-specific NAD(P)(+) transhydrogenase [Akkermansiaceae bacterium]|nr:Si-specific NAD(P)(+) transhydrogenase [Armatimonadota bacterium]